MTCTNAMWLKVSEEKDTCFQDSQIYNVSIKLFLKISQSFKINHIDKINKMLLLLLLLLLLD